jgi:peptidoglycan/LPS O-acetylase OafA/YrhL
MSSAGLPGAGAVRLAFLDGWRGVSILLVLLGHFLPSPGLSTARLGVELFFVLSGRLMAEILFVRTFPLGRFYQRRIARIFPALWVYCLLMWPLTRVFPVFNVRGWDVAEALSFSLNYFRAAQNGMSTQIDQVWSLCIEEHAYVLLSLMALVQRRCRWDPRVLLWGGAVLASLNGAVQTWVLQRGYYEVFWRTDVHVAAVLFAAACQLTLRPWLEARPGRLRSAVPLLAGALGLALNLYPVPDPVKHSLGTLALAASVVTLDFASAPMLALLSCGPLRCLGLWSFSLYLWQQPFAALRLQHEPFALMALLFGPALLSFYLVEKPARAFLNRLRWPSPERSAA